MNESTKQAIVNTIAKAEQTQEYRRIYRLIKGEHSSPNPDIEGVIACILKEIERSMRAYANAVRETKEQNGAAQG